MKPSANIGVLIGFCKVKLALPLQNPVKPLIKGFYGLGVKFSDQKDEA